LIFFVVLEILISIFCCVSYHEIETCVAFLEISIVYDRGILISFDLEIEFEFDAGDRVIEIDGCSCENDLLNGAGIWI
jgi:hypothetical protein